MSKKRRATTKQGQEMKKRTPTFLLELPLEVNEGQAKRLRAHLEVARLFYNAVRAFGQRRLRRMQADPAWQAARAIHCSHHQDRASAFSALRAYRALNRVCLGQAKRVRFKSQARRLDSIENKRPDTGLRFVLQPPEAGHRGYLVWQEDQLEAIIDWNDPVVKHGLDQKIKYARLIRRRASSARAQGADGEGSRYFVQLALSGLPYHKPKHTVGSDTIGVDLGPSTIALVARQGAASLETLCEELVPGEQQLRRLQRKMDRQRRAANPEHYDDKGRIKKPGKQRLRWRQSRGYERTRRRKAEKERKLAAHRKSLHGRKVHEIMRVGKTIIMEKLSYRAWQKQFGRSVGLRAPGMFIEMLKRTVASTGGTLIEVPTQQTKLSQFCHGCGQTRKKPLSQRWHVCACGVGSIQRDLYSAFLAAYLDAETDLPSCAWYLVPWEGAETRLRAAQERLFQRANEGQVLPPSMGMPRARARQPQSLSEPTQEPIFLLRRGRLEAWKEGSEPPVLEPGSLQK